MTARSTYSFAAIVVTIGLSACALQHGNSELVEPNHDTHVDLTSGNVEMMSVDGTALHLAPGTKLSIDTSAGPHEVTHVRLHTGHLHVSNIDHAHNDLMHVQAGEHTFTLHRGRAVVSHSEDGIHATLVEGQHLGAIGHEARVTEAGHRIRPGAEGMQRHVPEASELAALLEKTQAPGSP
jgi:ferric-dicitrate binding protein FerR (iron transport regulator)